MSGTSRTFCSRQLWLFFYVPRTLDNIQLHWKKSSRTRKTVDFSHKAFDVLLYLLILRASLLTNLSTIPRGYFSNYIYFIFLKFSHKTMLDCLT